MISFNRLPSQKVKSSKIEGIYPIEQRTTEEINKLTPIPGTFCYDTDKDQAFIFDGNVWLQFIQDISPYTIEVETKIFDKPCRGCGAVLDEMVCEYCRLTN